MTTPDTPPPRRRRVLIVALLFAVVATLWWVSELYTTDSARACREMYAGAKNAIDTNRIDLIAPASERRRAEPRTCATFRARTPP